MTLRLRRFLNAFALARVRRNLRPRRCALCVGVIQVGDPYRLSGRNAAHDYCYLAVIKEGASLDNFGPSKER